MIRFFMDLAILFLAIFILLELHFKQFFAVLFAAAIMFLADENSSRYIVGQILRVDGGQSVSGIIDCMKEDF
jgi:hypothetical protein